MEAKKLQQSKAEETEVSIENGSSGGTTAMCQVDATFCRVQNEETDTKNINNL